MTQDQERFTRAQGYSPAYCPPRDITFYPSGATCTTCGKAWTLAMIHGRRQYTISSRGDGSHQ